MKIAATVALILALAVQFAHAGALDGYEEAIDTIASWQKETDTISYKGSDRNLKAYAAAHNAEIKTIERENARVASAKATYKEETSLSTEKDGVTKLNKAAFGKGRQAAFARSRIKAEDAAKQAKRSKGNAKRKRIAAQKVALGDMRRALQKEKEVDEAKKDELLSRLDALIAGLDK